MGSKSERFGALKVRERAPWIQRFGDTYCEIKLCGGKGALYNVLLGIACRIDFSELN